MVNNKFLILSLSILFTFGNNRSAIAQTSVNLEQVEKDNKAKNSLKFIEGVAVDSEKSAEPLQEKSYYKNSEQNNTIANKSGLVEIEKCSAMQFKYAMMMDMEVENLTNAPLYNFIDEWWAIRYHYGGTDKSGIDCSAFASKILSTIYGINTPRTSAEQYSFSEKISKENLKEGDLVFFNTRGGVSHVGVYLGNNFFVHSSVKSGVTINSLTDDYYGRKFIGGGRIPRI